MLILFWALLGLSIGSFVNVLADRLPNGESILAPPSHCGACGRHLTAIEMIPALSFLALRGRCRACGAPIGARVLWVELATGLLFALAAWRAGLDRFSLWANGRGLIGLILTSVYLAVFVAVAVTDLEHGLILNVMVYPAIALAAIGTLVADPAAWLSHLLGGAIGAGVIALIIWLAPGGMGWGDVKLAGFVGLVTGLTGVGFALFTAFVSGGIVASFLLATGRKRRGQTIALGPFLAAGGALLLLIGNATALHAFHFLARLF